MLRINKTQNRETKLSVCIIVKDEEKNLPNILTDIATLNAEIIIVDTGSTDSTKAIAESFRAKVFDFEWCDDFSAARNCSLDHAMGDLIIWLDADDRITPESVSILNKYIPSAPKAFYMANVHNEGNHFLQLRIIPNDSRVRFKGRSHENIYDFFSYQQYLMPEEFFIEHTGYHDHETTMEKIRRNVRLMEMEEIPTYVCNFQLGSSYMVLNRFQDAAARLKLVIEDEVCKRYAPDIYYGALVMCADLMLLLQHPVNSKRLSYRAIEMRPYDIRGWYYLGRSVDNTELSLIAYQQGMRCQDYPASTQNMFTTYMEQCTKAARIIKGKEAA